MSNATDLEQPETRPTAAPLEPLVGQALGRRSFGLAVCSGLAAAVCGVAKTVLAGERGWVLNAAGDYQGRHFIDADGLRIAQWVPLENRWVLYQGRVALNETDLSVVLSDVPTGDQRLRCRMKNAAVPDGE